MISSGLKNKPVFDYLSQVYKDRLNDLNNEFNKMLPNFEQRN